MNRVMGVWLRSRTAALVIVAVASIGAVVLAGSGRAEAADVCVGSGCDTVALVDGEARFNLFEDLVASSEVARFTYGNPDDEPLMGDWDCDGEQTPAMYRRSAGFMYLRNSNTAGVADVSFHYGNPGDAPLAGDWDGDGCDTLAIYRPSQGKVYVSDVLGNGPAQYSYYFGNPGDKPFAGDFDADGIDTIGLHRRSTGLVYFRNTHTPGVADRSFIYGDPHDRVIAGDWDGDGVDTVAAYRPANGMLYLHNRHQAGVADHQLNVGAYRYALPASGIDQLPDSGGGGTPSPPAPAPGEEAWLGRAEALLSVFENATTEIQYGYAEALGDGRGITAGRAGFTSGTGDLVIVVRDYVAARPETPLAAYLPRLEELARNWSGSTAGLEGFIEDWAAAAEDPVMREIQDRVARELYFYPSQAIADQIGAGFPLTRAALFGTGIQHGIGDDPDGLPALVAETNGSMGGTPGSGVDERAWLESFLWIRRAHLEWAHDPATREAWQQTTDRVDVWLDLLSRDLLYLDRPFSIWVYGGEYWIP